MAIALGQNQYGKAETRVLRVYRDSDRHEIRDLAVSTSLRGDFADAHTRGDQAHVLPTDSQKNTCFAYAKEKGVGEIEDYAMELARHFTADVPYVSGARVEVDEYRWDRVAVAAARHPAGQPPDGRPGHGHTFVRAGPDVRTTAVTVEGRGSRQRAWVVSGLKDLLVLKSTGSEFSGFLTDRYTTLQETGDRVLATSLTARWRYGSAETDWGEAYRQIRQILLGRFATTHSLALQQTLWEMGSAVLRERTDVAEIRLSAPNRHHFLVDLAPFGLANDGEVFYAADRPYGLIQCCVERDDAPDPGTAWHGPGAFA